MSTTNSPAPAGHKAENSKENSPREAVRWTSYSDYKERETLRKRREKPDMFASDDVDAGTMLMSAATTFRPEDSSPADRERWDRLAKHQEDRSPQQGFDARQQQQDATYNWRVVESLCDRLDLTTRQRSAVHKLHERLDRQTFGKPVEVVIFCAAAYVLNEDPRRDRRSKWHPNARRTNRDKRFQQVAENIADVQPRYKLPQIKTTYFQLAHKYRQVWKVDVAELMDGKIPMNPSFRNKSDFVDGVASNSLVADMATIEDVYDSLD